MGNMTLAETIRSILLQHMEENDGLIFGQTLSSIGNTYGTIPAHKNVVELPMTDVAAAGIAAGASLVGRRSVFVLRFQDFFLLNSSPLLQDAALGKEYHGVPCPVFIRSIANDRAGPCHSNVMHSVAIHFPGIRVCAPMTPKEYREVWECFMRNDDPFYVSEHRRSYQITGGLKNEIKEQADITIIGISDTRLALAQAAEKLEAEGYSVNIVHLNWLKPLPLDELSSIMRTSRVGLVTDSARECCGACRDIAYQLMLASGKKVYSLGVKDHVKCLNPARLYPSPDADAICRKGLEILRGGT